MKRSFLSAVLSIVAFSLSAQDILSNYENYVNPLTGDFNWSEQVISIQSNNGTSYPITLSYNADVKTNQPASWVGLGWNLNVGEISRSIIGFPDDRAEYKQSDIQVHSGGVITEDTYGYGPMHFSKHNDHSTMQYLNESSMDVLFSSFEKFGPSAISPAFDKFQMSSGVAGGAFQLTQYDPLKYVVTPEDTDGDGTIDQYIHSYQGGDMNNEIVFRPYTQKISGTDTPHKCADNDKAYDYNVFQMDDDPLRNTYIVYYTNEQLGLIVPEGYIAYKDENGGIFDHSQLEPEAIGAFTVYLENGMRLHFSLPVYEKSSLSYSVRLGDNGLVLTNSDTTRVLKKDLPVITSWKLTAITGPDFVDLNNNLQPDDGDQGYWLTFQYAKWFDSMHRSPYYDFNYGTGIKDNKARNKSKFPFSADVQISTREQYYIDKIESDREKLIFFKSVRNDEFTDPQLGSGDKIPQLKLDKIVRYYKEGTTISKNNSLTGINPEFESLTGATNYRDLTYLDVDFDPAVNTNNILASVYFNQDYSLAQGYYRNIDNYSSSVLSAYSKYSNSNIPTVYTVPTNLGSGGKLTLNSIDFRQHKNVKLMDGYTFEYNGPNPRYHHNNFDLTGNYSLQSTSRESRYSDYYEDNNNASTWLLTAINFPNKTRVEAEYEYDKFQYQIATAHRNVQLLPVKKMKIESFNFTYSTNKAIIIVELFSDEDKHLLENLNGRELQFTSKFEMCSNLAETYYGYGSNSYDNGMLTATGTLNIISISTPNQVKIECLIRNKDSLAPSGGYCNPNNYITNAWLTGLNYAFFEISNSESYSVGTPRVAELRVKEKLFATDFYSLTYDYDKGIATSNLSPISKNGQGIISFTNSNTPYNTLPFQVVYPKTSIHKWGLGNTKLYSSDMYYKLPYKVKRGKGRIRSEWDGKLYIPTTAIHSTSIKYFWKFMHDEDFERDDLPEIIQCATETYVRKVLIANHAGLVEADYNDWEKIYRFIPSGLTFETAVGMVKESPDKIKCMWSSVQGGTRTINGSSGYYDFYTEFSVTSGTTNILLEVDDDSDILGKLDKIETFDADENLILRTIYEYARKGYVRNIYTSTFGRSTVVDNPQSGFLTHNKTVEVKNYFFPVRKYTYAKGLEYTEEIVSLDPYTGKPNVVRYFDPTKGISQKTTDYQSITKSTIGNRLKAKTWINDADNQIGKIEYRPVENFDPNNPIWYNNGTELLAHSSDKNILGITASGITEQYGIEPGYMLFQDITGLSKLTETSANSQVRINNIIETYNSSIGEYEYTTASLPSLSNPSAFAPANTPIASTAYNGLLKISRNKATYVNHLSHPLENWDSIHNLYTAHTYRLNDLWPIASVNNCRFGSFTATGFEDQVSGNVYFEGKLSGSANRYLPTPSDISSAHTGKYVCRIDNTSPEVAFTNNSSIDGGKLEAGRHYVASIWINNTSYSGTPGISVCLDGSIDGGNNTYNNSWSRNITHASNLVVGDWTLVEVEFEVPENYTSNNPHAPAGGSGPGSGPSAPAPMPSSSSCYNQLSITLTGMTGYCYFDDFRFHPVDCALEVKVYDDVTQRVTHVLDNQNLFLEIEYDEAGRPVQKKKESVSGVYILEETTYNNN